MALEESRLKRSIDRTKDAVDDESMTFEFRHSNLEQFLARQEELILLEQAKALMAKGLHEADITRIEEETQEKLLKLKSDGSKMAEKILTDQMSKEDALRYEAQKRTLASIEKERDEQLAALNEAFSSGDIPEQEYMDRRLALQQEYTRKYIEEELKAVEALMEINRARGIDTVEQEKQIAALKLRLSEETTKKQIEDLKKLADYEAALSQAKEDMLYELGNTAMTLVSARFERENQALERQSELLDENTAKDIKRVKDSTASEDEKATKIAIIEARAAKQKEALEARQRQLQERQARFEKIAVMASIIGNTAAAIMKQLAVTPLPLGAPLVATIGAIGGLQLAQAAAMPIPKFADGTDNSPEGPAIVGERGTELRIDPDGTRSLTPSGPTFTYLKKGTKIIPADETKKILAKQSMGDIAMYDNRGNADYTKLINSYEKGTKRLEKALGNKNEKSTVITKSGMKYIYKSGNSWQEYLGRNL